MLVISLGLVSMNVPPEFSEIIPRNSEHIRIHPRFNRDLIQFNIAMINLPNASQKMLDSQNIGTVELPPPLETFLGQTGVMAGFGNTEDGVFINSEYLYFVEQEIIPNQSCFDNYGFFVTHNTLCTNTSGGRSFCDGDFGGGLVIKGTNVLAGIASFASTVGCSVGIPTVYVRIGGYLDWINGVIYNNWTEPSTISPTTTTATDIPTTTTDDTSLVLIGNILIFFSIFLNLLIK
jgi:Trypsin